MKSSKRTFVIAATVAALVVVLALVAACVVEWRASAAAPRREAFADSVYRDYTEPLRYCIRQQELDFSAVPGAELKSERLNAQVLRGASSSMTAAQATSLCSLHTNLAGFVFKTPFIHSTNESGIPTLKRATEVVFFDDATLQQGLLTYKPQSQHLAYTKYARAPNRCRKHTYCPMVALEASTGPRGDPREQVSTKTAAQRVCDMDDACTGFYRDAGTGKFELLKTGANLNLTQSRGDADQGTITYLKSSDDCQAIPSKSPFHQQYQNYLENDQASQPFAPTHFQRSNQPSIGHVRNRTCDSTTTANSCFLKKLMKHKYSAFDLDCFGK